MRGSVENVLTMEFRSLDFGSFEFDRMDGWMDGELVSIAMW